MKHISAYFDQMEEANEKFAWWPIRTTFSNKRIWLKKYVELEVRYDSMGVPPRSELSWRLIYTPNEYTLYLLRKDSQTTVNRWGPRPGY